VSFSQYNLLNDAVNRTDYIITDGSLLLGLAYNLLNTNTTSNQRLTHHEIFKWYNEFDNINILLKRCKNVTHNNSDRNEDLEVAKRVDRLLKFALLDNNIEYLHIEPSLDSIDTIMEYLKLS
jgi:hypothetical protein